MPEEQEEIAQGVRVPETACLWSQSRLQHPRTIILCMEVFLEAPSSQLTESDSIIDNLLTMLFLLDLDFVK